MYPMVFVVRTLPATCHWMRLCTVWFLVAALVSRRRGAPAEGCAPKHLSTVEGDKCYCIGGVFCFAYTPRCLP